MALDFYEVLNKVNFYGFVRDHLGSRLKQISVTHRYPVFPRAYLYPTRQCHVAVSCFIHWQVIARLILGTKCDSLEARATCTNSLQIRLTTSIQQRSPLNRILHLNAISVLEDQLAIVIKLCICQTFGHYHQQSLLQSVFDSTLILRSCSKSLSNNQHFKHLKAYKSERFFSSKTQKVDRTVSCSKQITT